MLLTDSPSAQRLAAARVLLHSEMRPHSDDVPLVHPVRRATTGAAQVVLRTVAFYAFAGWVYVALNAVVHPDTLHLPLTHFASWPHEDTFGAACFATSFVSALLAQLLRRRSRAT